VEFDELAESAFKSALKGPVAKRISDFLRILHSVYLDCFCSEQCKSAPQAKQANRRQVEKGKLNRCGLFTCHLKRCGTCGFKNSMLSVSSDSKGLGMPDARGQYQAVGADHGE